MARVTIKEIAKKAGVSIGTVDRVINNRGKVRPETENRIRQICNELGYESNFLAKALVLGKKESNIAVIITNPERNGFTRNVKNGFDAAAEKLRDYNVHFNFYFLEKNVEDKIIEYLAELRLNPPSGIIIKPCDSEKVRTVLSEFTDMGIPIITCTSDLDGVDALCFVGQNHYQDGRIAANMLCLQFKEEASLAVITNPPRVSAQRQRMDGFFSYLKETNSPLKIVEILEVDNDADLILAETYGLLKRYPNLNALYVHTTHIDATMKALQLAQTGGNLIAFTFGCREEVAAHLQSSYLTFAIEERPYHHGYVSAITMFNYLFLKTMPLDKKLYQESRILLKESAIGEGI